MRAGNAVQIGVMTPRVDKRRELIGGEAVSGGTKAGSTAIAAGAQRGQNIGNVARLRHVHESPCRVAHHESSAARAAGARARSVCFSRQMSIAQARDGSARLYALRTARVCRLARENSGGSAPPVAHTIGPHV